jgi:hypothetical protein
MIRASITSIPGSASRTSLARRVNFDNPPLQGSCNESMQIHSRGRIHTNELRDSTDSHEFRTNPSEFTLKVN